MRAPTPVPTCARLLQNLQLFLVIYGVCPPQYRGYLYRLAAVVTLLQMFVF
jgi:hypothetical protein